jgi:hypothetical protein
MNLPLYNKRNYIYNIVISIKSVYWFDTFLYLLKAKSKKKMFYYFFSTFLMRIIKSAFNEENKNI